MQKPNDAPTTDARTSTPAHVAMGHTPSSCDATQIVHPSLPTVPDLTTTTSATSSAILTPVNKANLSELLEGYPDRNYIIDGLTNGFTLHFDGPQSPLASKNSPSIVANIQIARAKIQSELSLGRIAGPFKHPPFQNFKTSPLALREKSTPGKFRLLHNLSYPYDDNSVNYNISKKYTTVKYQNIQNAIQLLQSNAPDAYMAKSDISDAFRIIPVHSSQYHLLGFKLDQLYYHDKMLGMGAAPSCRIFEDFSDAIIWILQHRYNITNVVKVLDDFLFISHDLHTCQHYLSTFIHLCQHIGVPIAHNKTEGPAQVLTFLGIELDSVNMQARLPDDKLHKYRTNVHHIANSSTCTLREIKSVIGQLTFTTSVIPPGRAFLRRLHNLTIGKLNPNQIIKIHNSAKQDLLMWANFLNNHNGRTIIRPLSNVISSQINLCADASKIGFGATYGKAWIQGTWPDHWKTLHISFLEMFPIYLTIRMFAHKLRNSSIMFYSDNMAVVYIINNQSSKCFFIMQLIRPLVLTLLHHNIHLKAAHIPGVDNILCDAISRRQVTPALLLQYGAQPHPTEIPTHLQPTNFKINWPAH